MFVFQSSLPRSSLWSLEAERAQQDQVPPSRRNRPLRFQGSSAPFSSPLTLISSFHSEHGSRIAAFKANSTARFLSPLAAHRNRGNNRDVERPVITTLVLYSLFFFFFFVAV